MSRAAASLLALLTASWALSCKLPTEGSATETSSGSSSSGSVTADATAASAVEGSGSSGHVDSSSCCEAHTTPGCEEPDVAHCVCETDAVCCAITWDVNCVQLAQTCNATCMPPAGDTGSASVSASAGTGDGGTSVGESGPSTTDPSAGTSDGGDSGGGAGSGNCCFQHGAAGCDASSVEQCVCAFDEYCCYNEWDGQCVQEALADCDAVCSSCCTPHPNMPGCSDDMVEQCVCAFDEYCCWNEWDGQCVQEAIAVCGQRC